MVILSRAQNASMQSTPGNSVLKAHAALLNPGRVPPIRHILSRSRNRFFLSVSFGLVATPSSHESTFATVTVCSSSGAFTRIVRRVPGASGISARTPCLKTAIASTAASKRLSAGRCRDHVEGKSERPNRRRQNPGGDEYRPRSDTAGIIRSVRSPAPGH